MNQTVLLLPIVLPLAAAVPVVLARGRWGWARVALSMLTTLTGLVCAIVLFRVVQPGFCLQEMRCTVPWAGFGLEFSLRLYPFSAFVLLATGAFALLTVLYAWKFMRGREHLNQFYCYLLITVAMLNGAVLADHLMAMLFCWEGLLLTLFGLIAIGRPGAWKTATKAFIIVGISDLCMMIGIAMVGWIGVSRGLGLTEALTISKIHLPVEGAAVLAMVLLLIGALSKAGAMPFHSWIPDAANDAPLPFMALLPASLEKMLGIYFLARITLDMFEMSPGSWVSFMLMTVGAVTILLAVAMALVQKDYKRLLSYHAISQVGYMILGIGTALPVGIVGGLFHLLNNAMYKSCLFMTGGAVEKQAGTTDLSRLGGLGRNMPITFGCFLVASFSISGFPLTNGFFSKELVYDGALERHTIFYVAALLGSVLTAASFLKLGHAAFLGPRRPENDGVREAPAAMLAAMIVIAAGCLLFGVGNALPLNYLIQPAVGPAHLDGQQFGGLHFKPMLVTLTVASLALAFLNHLFGVKRTGLGLGAVDHIHHAPILHGVYDMAEKRYFDPYDLGWKVAGAFARLGWWVDRAFDWLVDDLPVGLTRVFTAGIRAAHTGNYSLYAIWSLIGAAAVIVFLMISP